MTIPQRCELISWHRAYALCRVLAQRIRRSGFTPDTLIAIGRGGYVPARVLADLLGLMDLIGIKIEHYRAVQRQPRALVRQPLTTDLGGRRVLVVDDVSDSGDTFQVAVDHVASRGHPAEIRTAALHHKRVSHFVPDYYAHKVMRWRWISYPWAVVEDLTAFLAIMDPMPETVAEAQRRLREERGIRVAATAVLDALTLCVPPSGNAMR